MKRHESIINERIISDFSVIRGKSLINHVSNSYDIEMAIGFASLYCPEIVEVDGCIFIAEFYNGNIESLKEQYKNTKDIEMFVNSWSLTGLLSDNERINYDINFVDEFAKAIQYFWHLRVKELFPDKKVIVEIGEGIMGEEGLAVTLFQAE